MQPPNGSVPALNISVISVENVNRPAHFRSKYVELRMPVRLGGFYELRSITKRQFAVLLNGALLTAHRSASALTLAESMSNSTSAELAYLLRSTAVISPL